MKPIKNTPATVKKKFNSIKSTRRLFHVARGSIASALLLVQKNNIHQDSNVVTKSVLVADNKKSPPSELFDEEYYLTRCSGYKEFLKGETSYQCRKTLKKVALLPKEKVLDIGCGRGEMIKECTTASGEIAVGIDYSLDAVRIASKYTNDGNIIRASATHLPFRNEIFDKIILLEVFNHLSEKDLNMCLNEIHRVLRIGGKVIIRTPNRWGDILYLSYNIYMSAFRRQRFNYRRAYYSKRIVNTKNPLSLWLTLKNARFQARVYFDIDYKGHIPQFVYGIFLPLMPLWCIAYKKAP